MPTWSGIIAELNAASPTYGDAAFDVVRLDYLKKLSDHTKRATILYATKWTQAQPGPAEDISITDEDMQGLMEVIHELDNDKLDLIIHSPGGSPEATEALVDYLRTKFTHIRAIVPQAAMSAACMMACATDEIVMGKHSSLGPIDPQMILPGKNGPMIHPAQAILEQAKMIEEKCKEPALREIWSTQLEFYMPSILIECKHASELSENLVKQWLGQWMLKDTDASEETCARIARQLNDHEAHKSHSRRIHRDRARDLGLKIVDLEENDTLQDLVLSVFHVTTLTFTVTPAVKIIGNNLGALYMKASFPDGNAAASPDHA